MVALQQLKSTLFESEQQAMNTQETSVSNDAALFEELAVVENELVEVVQLQANSTQAAIWAYNAWTSTDAMLEREPSQDLISRLEKLSNDADAIKAESDTLVKALRERRRKLTRKLKSKVYSPEMNREREKVAELADANILLAKEAESAKAEANVAFAASEASQETTEAQVETQTQTVETVKPKAKRKAAKQ